MATMFSSSVCHRCKLVTEILLVLPGRLSFKLIPSEYAIRLFKFFFRLLFLWRELYFVYSDEIWRCFVSHIF